MTKWITINHPSEMRKPLLFPWSIAYKCKGCGYFYDGEYGYLGLNSRAKDWCGYYLNVTLSKLGLYAEWRRGGSGKWIIKRRFRK